MMKQFLKLVQEALSEHISAICRLRNERKRKEDESYVTEGDLLVQSLVRELVEQQLPGAVLISEEQRDAPHNARSGITVVMDPIDGTENFTSGLPEWGVSICCYEDGKHAASLIGCPEMDLWIQTGDPVSRFESRIRGLSSSLSKEDLIHATEGFEYRVLGCCVYNMINVIRGSFCSFENPKGAWSWDILAGLNLALEHGLKVTVEGKDYHGEYLSHTEKYRFKIEG